MDMSIRCAVCGSKNVVKEYKKEGYDVTKGVVGTVLVGLPGALAGAGGKDVTYYHCADCGQVMNRPMYQVTSDWIDKLLENPQQWIESLREEKKRYKNIEWEETQVDAFNEPKLATHNHTAKQKEIEERIIRRLKETPRMSGYELCDINDRDECFAFNELLINKRIVQEDGYFRLVTDENERETLMQRSMAINMISKKISENISLYKKILFEHVECHRPYSREELDVVFPEIFADVIDFNEPYMKEFFTAKLIIALKYNKDYDNKAYCREEWSNVKDEKDKVIFRSDEEIRKNEQDRFDTISEKIIEYLVEKMDYERCARILFYVQEKLHDENISIYEIEEILETLVSQKQLVVEKRRGYAIADIEERKEKIQAEKLAQAEEEYNTELEILQKQLIEQEAIIEANARKIFGAGAREKQEARQQIEICRKKMKKIKRDYVDRVSTLKMTPTEKTICKAMHNQVTKYESSTKSWTEIYTNTTSIELVSKLSYGDKYIIHGICEGVNRFGKDVNADFTCVCIFQASEKAMPVVILEFKLIGGTVWN